MARIAGINIPQNKVVSIALTYIHGIGLHSSKKICEKLNIASSKRVNELSEEEVLKIREFIDANHKVEGDLRREIRNYSNKKRIENFMSKNPMIVNENMTASKALSIMNDKKITSLLVVDDNNYVRKNKILKGIIHIHSLLEKGIR